MLDIVRLRVLAAVAAHGSVTEAAKALHYSQPSVSHHLARLEAATGARLIQRVGRGIRLTPEGELLARRATEIVGRVDAAGAELDAQLGLRTGRVRLVAFSSALSALVPAAAVALRESYPNIELHLGDAHPTAARRMLRAGAADLAIVFSYEDTMPDDGIRYSYLLDDPVYLLSSESGQTLADHRDSAWIAGCPNCRGDLVRICEDAGFTPRIAYSSDDVLVQQAFVAAGLGVTTMPGLALRTHHADGVQATELTVARRRIHLAAFGEPPDPPATTAFIAALRTALDGRRHG
ncbi:LysR family transcriptional regulator [Nonomuraea glycinis]|uniref:LysR family transcriptional regulator n=1 Tax=Nonomuraea glycinis TaxID=2047744 RepID=A0A918ACI2_9ACTN|nr:LysR family transcriptional regulator [Nonomuraea glycinis]MCA2181496.1 LysR family transcriptional regulator [Nonomuraea glycinis]GGP14599.1 LysR family transcriptional regulator [Nonomuraea glycinis]